MAPETRSKSDSSAVSKGGVITRSGTRGKGAGRGLRGRPRSISSNSARGVAGSAAANLVVSLTARTGTAVRGKGAKLADGSAVPPQMQMDTNKDDNSENEATQEAVEIAESDIDDDEEEEGEGEEEEEREEEDDEEMFSANSSQPSPLASPILRKNASPSQPNAFNQAQLKQVQLQPLAFLKRRPSLPLPVNQLEFAQIHTDCSSLVDTYLCFSDAHPDLDTDLIYARIAGSQLLSYCLSAGIQPNDPNTRFPLISLQIFQLAYILSLSASIDGSNPAASLASGSTGVHQRAHVLESLASILESGFWSKKTRGHFLLHIDLMTLIYIQSCVSENKRLDPRVFLKVSEQSSPDDLDQVTWVQERLRVIEHVPTESLGIMYSWTDFRPKLYMYLQQVYSVIIEADARQLSNYEEIEPISKSLNQVVLSAPLKQRMKALQDAAVTGTSPQTTKFTGSQIQKSKNPRSAATTTTATSNMSSSSRNPPSSPILSGATAKNSASPPRTPSAAAANSRATPPRTVSKTLKEENDDDDDDDDEDEKMLNDPDLFKRVARKAVGISPKKKTDAPLQNPQKQILIAKPLISRSSVASPHLYSQPPPTSPAAESPMKKRRVQIRLPGLSKANQQEANGTAEDQSPDRTIQPKSRSNTTSPPKQSNPRVTARREQQNKARQTGASNNESGNEDDLPTPAAVISLRRGITPTRNAALPGSFATTVVVAATAKSPVVGGRTRGGGSRGAFLDEDEQDEEEAALQRRKQAQKGKSIKITSPVRASSAHDDAEFSDPGEFPEESDEEESVSNENIDSDSDSQREYVRHRGQDSSRSGSQGTSKNSGGGIRSSSGTKGVRASAEEMDDTLDSIQAQARSFAKGQMSSKGPSSRQINTTSGRGSSSNTNSAVTQANDSNLRYAMNHRGIHARGGTQNRHVVIPDTERCLDLTGENLDEMSMDVRRMVVNTTNELRRRGLPAQVGRKIRGGARVRWSVDEVAALEEGMREHGIRWTLIEQEYGLNGNQRLAGRDQVSLKDKARNEYQRRSREGLPLGVYALIMVRQLRR
ncbi:hypothetical protein BJ741DRAFT_652952 [Chytriomyces cf. hyalinus JEL632]|nr:hypothetical protein BJ741DRAFT_652952 [Chytriomyces cf. hyalinus JEL632]